MPKTVLWEMQTRGDSDLSDVLHRALFRNGSLMGGTQFEPFYCRLGQRHRPPRGRIFLCIRQGDQRLWIVKMDVSPKLPLLASVFPLAVDLIGSNTAEPSEHECCEVYGVVLMQMP
jgi:hypothetical protein